MSARVSRAAIDSMIGAVDAAEGLDRREVARRAILAVRPHLIEPAAAPDTAVTCARYHMALEAIAAGNVRYTGDLAKAALKGGLS